MNKEELMLVIENENIIEQLDRIERMLFTLLN